MTEEGETSVSTKVLQLANRLDIDPELAQEVYSASNLSHALDGLDKTDLAAEYTTQASMPTIDSIMELYIQ